MRHASLVLALALAACDETVMLGESADLQGPAPFGVPEGGGWTQDALPDAFTPDGCTTCEAPTGFCGGRADGDFCSGAKLIHCQSGATTGTTPCPAGCIAPPGGLPHVCAAPPGDAFCDGRPDGAWCDGSTLVACEAGAVSAEVACPLGCASAPQPHCAADSGEALCSGKPDGPTCSGSLLVTCAGGLATGQTPCSLGCAAGPPAQCEAAVGDAFCAPLQDGTHCKGSTLVTCSGGKAASQAQCLNGCVAGAGAGFCASGTEQGFCAGKADGPWCDGQALRTCAGGQIAATTPCPFGCVVHQDGDACGDPSNPTFCAGLPDGPHCNGPALAVCQGGQVTSELGCPFGCKSEATGASCAADTFCAVVPQKASQSPPAAACSAMDWTLEPDGFYLISQFGTTNDPTTLGKPTSCGYLQSQYNAKGCAWDAGAGACTSAGAQIPWIQGHVDWDYAKVVGAGFGGPSAYFYVAGAQRFGCGALLRVTNPATGACVVAYAEDGGPGALYEGATYGGRRIVDASPAVIATLAIQKTGWKNSDLVRVEWGKPGDVPGQPCAPCAAIPAKLGTENNAAPWSLLHMVPSCGTGGEGCPAGPGLYCGTPPQDTAALYYCANGSYTLQSACTGGCQQNPPGTPDSCAGETPKTCPSGDGFYCGASVGLDPQTLYACKGGSFATAQVCPSGCQTMPAGQNDQCQGAETACPAGDGAYCGGSLGKDPGTLYQCTGGQASVLQVCQEGCQVKPPGSPDACYAGPAACPGGNGAYCGASVGKDGNTLYQCTNGTWSVLQSCPSGCQQMPAGTQDQCKGGSCPSGDGAYCGSSVGGDANTLYACKGGALSPLQTCSAGCQVNAAGTDDACKSAGGCPAGNGAYCGGALGKDASTLYQCTNGATSVIQVCPNGCQQNPPGTPDSCAGSPTGKLVMCNPFKPPKGVTCAVGCYAGHAGSDYATNEGTPVYSPIDGTVSKVVNTVPGQTCAPDFGNHVRIAQGSYEVILAHMRKDIQVGANAPVSMGQLVGYVSNTGYTLSLVGGAWKCQAGGGYHLHLETRKSGAAFDPYASSNVTWAEGCGGGGGGSCPSGDGLYCGGSVGKDSNTLYSCAGGSYSVVQSCPNGCQSMPAGQSDQCATGASCPSGNGDYCGSSLGKDSNTLYKCTDGVITEIQKCSNGCETMPAGTSDQCKADSPKCPSGNGNYCGSSLGKDANTLYKCTDGSITELQKCSNGCETMPAGTSDQCKSGGGCPSGNGLYCGGSLGKDGKTLYNCTNGSTSFSAYCASGCTVAPPGQSDYCAGGSCPSGNGAYCGQTGGLSSSTLYNCSNGKWTVLQQCGGTCVVAPPGQPDKCP
ncbi:MAG: hypothetical protein AMXMBFR64_26460 [Myxococcales bacterium]